jgi:hypothetical protein
MPVAGAVDLLLPHSPAAFFYERNIHAKRIDFEK